MGYQKLWESKQLRYIKRDQRSSKENRRVRERVPTTIKKFKINKQKHSFDAGLFAVIEWCDWQTEALVFIPPWDQNPNLTEI